jgi:hypothetical protein
MLKSKEIFMEMREEEIVLIYKSDFTKKHAQAKGKELVEKILDEGLMKKEDALVNLIRICEVLNTAKDTLKDALPNEKITHLGVEITPMNGRKIYNFTENTEWVELNEKIKKLEKQLKNSANIKDAIYDAETGAEIEKVSISNAKSSLIIKF